MKKLLIILTLVGLSLHSFAQVNEESPKPIELENVIITPLNTKYLNKVQDYTTPENVKALEKMAARYDISESDAFNDERFDFYEVIFQESGASKGKIVATYNSEGKILSSVEKYKNVNLPIEVTKAVVMKYPGWEIINDLYIVKYYEKSNEVIKTYKIQIGNGDSKKNLRVSPQGLVK